MVISTRSPEAPFGVLPSGVAAHVVIEQVVQRGVRISADEARQACEMLDYVDAARVVGETAALTGGDGPLGDVVLRGRREVDGALHELSMALRVPVKTLQDLIAMSRRVRSLLPSVWAAWLGGGHLTTDAVTKIDAAGRRFTRAESLDVLDEAVVAPAMSKTIAQLVGWLDRFVERTEADRMRTRHALAAKDRRVWIRPDRDGMTRITGLIPTLAATAISARLDTLTRETLT